MDFYDAAEYCEETFGAPFNRSEEWFICPECGEPLYLDDWGQRDWHTCPVCEVAFEEMN